MGSVQWVSYSAKHLVQSDNFLQLKTLDERLNPGKARKAVNRIGVRALK